MVVALGAAFLAGTLVLSDTVRTALESTFAQSYANVDVHVRAKPAFTSWLGDERSRLDADLVGRVAAVDGVSAAEARIEGYAQLFDRRGAPVGSPDESVGTNWSRLEDNPFRLVAGRAPLADDEVVIDRGTASASGYTVGDRVRVATNAGPAGVTVVGISVFGSLDSPGGSPYVLFTQPAAERLIAQPARIDAIVAVAGPGVSAEALRDRVATALADEVEVLTSAELATEKGSITAGATRAMKTILLAFASVALFVGAFIINNTFSILVAQRTKEVALLRALGATRSQVIRSVLVEASVIGVLGAAAGAFSGAAVAAGLRDLVSNFGFDLPKGAVVVRPSALLVPTAIGALIAVASAVFPARRAAAVPPIVALRDAAVDTSPHSRRRIIVGTMLLTVGSGLVFGPLLTGQEMLTTIGLGTAVIFLGLAAIGPAIAPPFVRLVANGAGRLGGVPLELARENTARNARRTSGAAASLTIGIGLVTLIAVFAASAKASVSRPYDGPAATRPDFVIQPASPDMTGFSPTLARRIADLPEIETVAVTRAAVAEVDGDPGLHVHGVDPGRWAAMVGDTTVKGAPAELRDDEVSVLEVAARMKGWTVGSVITLRFADREQPLRVASMRSSGPPFLINLATYEALVADQLDMAVLVRIQGHVSTDAAETAIRGIMRDYPTATLLDARGKSPQQVESIEQFANAVYVLLGLALLIAVVGIATTLALSVVERTREVGLLRAVGMTAQQVEAMVRWESLLIVLFGCGLGLVSGLFFGWAVLQGLPDSAAFRVPVVQLLAVTGLAATAAVVAAVAPARKASHLRLLTAMAES